MTSEICFKQVPRFNVNDYRMEEYFKQHGYVVVASVASEEEIQKAKSKFWDFMEAHSSVKRDDVNTWDKNWLPNESNGILGTFIHEIFIIFYFFFASHCIYVYLASYNFSHSDFLWDTRLLPKVKAAFEKLWFTPNLIVSFDGGNAFRPWKHNPLWLTSGGWWHVDQNSYNRPQRKGLTDKFSDKGKDIFLYFNLKSLISLGRLSHSPTHFLILTHHRFCICSRVGNIL